MVVVTAGLVVALVALVEVVALVALLEVVGAVETAAETKTETAANK